MKSTFEPLGKFVRLVDERNTDMVTESVLGINIDKYFMPSVANVIGTDLSNYKLLRKGRFACNPMHVGRDGRLPVSRYTEDAPAIVSPAYFMFEIVDEDVIEPEYLMLCFRRPDFDRMCWFRTDASVRGGITWEDVCALTIPVPPIDEQRKIVHDYQVITDRIDLLRKMNENLEAQVMTIFESCFGIPDSAECDKGIPVGWRTFSLSDVMVTTTSSVDPQRMEEPFVWHYSIPAFDAERLPVWDDPRTILSNKYRVPLGSILVSKLNPDTKRIWLSDSEFNNAICSTEFIIYIPKKKEHRAFYYMLFNTKGFVDFLVSNATGSTNSRMRVKPLSTLDYVFAVPNEEAIGDYSMSAEPFLRRINENNKEIRKLKLLWPIATTAMAMGF